MKTFTTPLTPLVSLFAAGRLKIAAAAFAVAFCFSAVPTQAADPAVTCELGKLKHSSKYMACRLRAEAKAVRTGKPADYAGCEAKFSRQWARLEAMAGPGVCPSEGDEVSMSARITVHAAEVATLLAGGTVAGCGDGIANGDEQCDAADLAGATCESLGYTLGGVLACGVGCGFDTAGCASPQYPATGAVVAAGPGSDGDVQAGAALSYTDNGDGTITDDNTGLMWEKKDNNPTPTIHDVDNEYMWSTGTGDMDGTIKTVFLDTLNDVSGGGANCFAGYCDWRIPNAKELYSIVDFGGPLDPALLPASGDYYFSSTGYLLNSNTVWGISGGGTTPIGKNLHYPVRAVRGGS